MWVLVRIALALGAVFHRLFLQKIVFKFRKPQIYGRTEVVHSENGNRLYIASSSTIPFILRRENGFTRFLKSLNLAAELQTNDKNFDEHIYIGTDHPSLRNALARNQTLRGAAAKLFENGCRKIMSTGNGYICFVFKLDQITPRAFALDNITSLDQVTQAVEIAGQAGRTERDPFFVRAVILEVVLLAASVFATGAWFQLVLDKETGLLNPFALVLPGLGLGAAAIVAWLCIVVVVMRGSARIAVLLADSLLAGCLTVAFVGPQAMVDLNQALDKSPRDLVVGKVDSKYSRTTGSGRRQRTNYYLELTLPSSNYNIPNRMQVNSFTYYRFDPPQLITLAVRRGYFDAPYISQMIDGANLNAPPPPKTTKHQRSDLANFATELPPPPKPASVNMVKYPDGKVRSSEPMLRGKINGFGEYWHENGELYGKIFYIDGKKEGQFMLRHPDGTPEAALSYRDGKLHGLQRWYKGGTLSNVAIYENDQHIKISQSEKRKIMQQYREK